MKPAHTTVADREQLIPWEDAVNRADRRRLMNRAGVQRKPAESPLLPATLGRMLAGPRGSAAGRTPWETKIPMHYDSTAAAMALYPWIPGRALPSYGPAIGRDAWSGNLWCFDPWQLRDRRAARRHRPVPDRGDRLREIGARQMPGHPARRVRPVLRRARRHPRRMGARRAGRRRHGAAARPGDAAPRSTPWRCPANPPGSTTRRGG